jgi:tetratricopeptide (TPR) repeat protein
VLWRSKKPFHRTEALAAADRARARGRHKRAITGYREVLAVHPDDLSTHGKLAPLLARRGDRAGALASFRAASDGQVKAGFTDRALSLLAQAANAFPDEEPLWSDIARLHLARGRRADAVAALVRGGWRLLRSRRPDVGERIVRLSLQIEPWEPEAVLVLARLLARQGRRSDAVALLDALAPRVRGKNLATSRGLAMRLAPSPRRLWRWLRAVFLSTR